MRTCRRCKRSKDDLDFHERQVNGKWYHHSWCRDCMREYARQWRSRNPGYYRERRRMAKA